MFTAEFVRNGRWNVRGRAWAGLVIIRLMLFLLEYYDRNNENISKKDEMLLTKSITEKKSNYRNSTNR